MKKLMLLLLLACGTPWTLFAQHSVKADIMSCLREEGYAPAYDEDGDIKFKVQGTTYYAFVKEVEGEAYAYVEVLAGFTTDTVQPILLEIANRLNRDKYVCKCMSYYDSDGDNAFQIAMEFITDSRENTEFQIRQAVRLIPIWIAEFESELDKW